MLFASAEGDHIGSYIVKDVCIHNPETRNCWEGINRRNLLLYGGGVTAIWAVLVNVCDLEF
jgi:hypothetical protein